MSLSGAPTPQLPGVNTPDARYWCNTKMNMLQCSYIWTIHNFSFCFEETGELIESSTFSASANDETKWCLQLYPKSINKEHEGFSSLFVKLVSSKNAEVKFKLKISILNGKRQEIEIVKGECTHRFKQGLTLGYPKFIKREFLFNKTTQLLPEDKLTILCELSVAGDRVNICRQSHAIELKEPKHKISEDLGILFYNQQFSDVTLAVGDYELQAHKIILAARSNVFAAMFKHEMEERQLSRVVITDIDHEVLKEMLRFIYTDTAPNLDKMAFDLLAAADKYAIESLKMMCEEALRAKLSVENAADTLILADLHSAQQLKAQTMDFICAHSTDVMKTTAWQNMLTTHSHLVAEILRAFAMKFE